MRFMSPSLLVVLLGAGISAFNGHADEFTSKSIEKDLAELTAKEVSPWSDIRKKRVAELLPTA